MARSRTLSAVTEAGQDASVSAVEGGMGGIIAELERQRRKLLSYVARRDRDRSRSEDIVQEVMLRVLEQSRKQEIADPLAYAYRVADSVIYAQAGRREGRNQPLSDDFVCEQPLADEVLQHRQRVERFRRALATLTPLQRQVFLLRHLEGKSRQDIADQLGLSVEAVKKHLVRSMAELAQSIDRDGGAQ